MKVTVSKSFPKADQFLKEQNETGISRLREIEIINQSKKHIANFKPIYEAYFTSILNYVYQKVGDKAHAADITSQVFMKAMTNLNSYKIQEVPFSAWLYKIAYNETMYFFRKTKKVRTVVLDNALIDGIYDELDEFPKEQILHTIESMIADLKPDDFELIELRYYQSKSFREIGFVLGCSENNAKVKLHRLIRKLRHKLIKGIQDEKI